MAMYAILATIVNVGWAIIVINREAVELNWLLIWFII